MELAALLAQSTGQLKASKEYPFFLAHRVERDNLTRPRQSIESRNPWLAQTLRITTTSDMLIYRIFSMSGCENRCTPSFLTFSARCSSRRPPNLWRLHIVSAATKPKHGS